MLGLESDSSEEDEELNVPATHPQAGPVKSILFQENDEEEDEEEDAPLPVAPETADFSQTPTIIISSQEFSEAAQAIAADCWDTRAWMIYIEEADAHRSGSVTVEEAYNRLLSQFPRAYSYWRGLIDYYFKNGDSQSLDAAFSKCLPKCRDVDVWMDYLQHIKRITVDKVSRIQEQHAGFVERQNYEQAFDRAVEAVGISAHSGVLWRTFIDFIRNWPDVGSMDAGKRMLTLRKLYQRALCIPMDCLDDLWREYEQFEKSAGELLAERVLPEYHEKYLHAKAIYKDRMMLLLKITPNRLATPPTHSLRELRDLDACNQWIRFEMSNPDNLTPEGHRSMMTLVFDQALSWFRYHAEIWMCCARFEQVQEPARVPEARSILREAIEVIPNVAYLRVALSELEEVHGSIETAREVLRTAFEKQPTPFTFSVLQRFVRRTDGIDAARKLFSGTYALRMDKTLGYEVYLAHAKLELDSNAQPDVALRVLNLARTIDPDGCSSVQYVQLLTRILLRMGDLKQIQWVYQTVLGDEFRAIVAGELGIQSSSKQSLGANLIQSGLSDATEEAHDNSVVVRTKTLPEQLQLWEDYLEAERILGLSSVSRLNELRAHRDRVKQLCEDQDRRNAVNNNGPRTGGIFDCARELCERYGDLLVNCFVDNNSSGGSRSGIGSDDADLESRSRGRQFLYEMKRLEEEKALSMKELAASGRKGRGGVAGEAGPGLAENPHLIGIPPLLRELIARLPSHSAPPSMDVETCLKQLRSMVLPPRPSPEEGELSAIHGKRGRNSGILLEGEEAAMEDREDDDEDDEGVEFYGKRDDIFKRRQRQRLLLKMEDLDRRDAVNHELSYTDSSLKDHLIDDASGSLFDSISWLLMNSGGLDFSEPDGNILKMTETSTIESGKSEPFDSYSSFGASMSYVSEDSPRNLRLSADEDDDDLDASDDDAGSFSSRKRKSELGNGNNSNAYLSTAEGGGKQPVKKKRQRDKEDDLEERLRILRDENYDLASHLKDMNTRANELELQRAEMEQTMAAKIAEIGDAEDTDKKDIISILRKYSDVFADYGASRQKEVAFHLNRLKKLLLPTQTTKMCLWTLQQDKSFYQCNKSPLFDILSKELAISPDQAARIQTHREKFLSLLEKLQESIDLTDTLQETIRKQHDLFQTKLGEFQATAMTPKQIVLFLAWVDHNAEQLSRVIPNFIRSTFPSMVPNNVPHPIFSKSISSSGFASTASVVSIANASSFHSTNLTSSLPSCTQSSVSLASLGSASSSPRADSNGNCSSSSPRSLNDVHYNLTYSAASSAHVSPTTSFVTTNFFGAPYIPSYLNSRTSEGRLADNSINETKSQPSSDSVNS